MCRIGRRRQRREEGISRDFLQKQVVVGYLVSSLYLEHEVNCVVCTSYQLLYWCVADGTLEGEEICRQVLDGETRGQQTTWKASEKME